LNDNGRFLDESTMSTHMGLNTFTKSFSQTTTISEKSNTNLN